MEQPPSASLQDVLITDELSRRSYRSPDLERENQTLHALARQMAEEPQELLKMVVRMGLELCSAGSAGVSLLETTPAGEEIFRWVALAGRLEPREGGSTPRNWSPCGVCLDCGEPVLFSYPARFFTYFNDVDVPIVEGLVIPFKGFHGKVLGTIWVLAHDERRRFDAEDARIMTSLGSFTAAALEYQRFFERLRQAQLAESIGTLAGGVAHDFNNLLTGILGNASLLANTVPNYARRMAEDIVQASERAAQLTNQLLIYAGKGRFVKQRMDLSHGVEDIVALFHSSIPEKVQVKLDLASNLPPLEIDPDQLRQLVLHLLMNAVEAITAPSGDVLVRTRLRQVDEQFIARHPLAVGQIAPGSYVCLEVSDSGSGIDDAIRAKMFDPFFSTKFMGRGMGLAAVYGIVRSQNGGITVNSAPGEGASIKVFLPVQPTREMSSQPSQQPRDRITTILMVDDEDIVRNFLKASLERQGYRVLLAEHGREALSVFDENIDDISLVLLDLKMPVMGGDEILPLLKRRRPDVRVIISSGYDENYAVRLFAGKGVSAFIQKPYTSAKLNEKLALLQRGQ